MNKDLQISFITINYNGLADTCQLIMSLQDKIHSVTYEIIVVDNASVQDEAGMIREKYPEVTVVRSERNTGFSGGSNLGIKQARGKYIFLINNDTYFENDGVHFLVERLESSPKIGAVSPKIKFAFPPQNIQFAGYTPLSPITLRNHLIGFGQPDQESYDVPSSSPYLHGAAMLVKREVIDKVGMMPELFFLYYEELDWCTHIVKAGYELWYEPRCTVFHKESQSTGQESKLRTFYLTRNRLLYAARNLTGTNKLLSIVYQLCVAAPKNVITYLIKGRFAQAGAVVRGVWAFVFLKNINQ